MKHASAVIPAIILPYLNIILHIHKLWVKQTENFLYKTLTVMLWGYVPVSSRNRQTLNNRFSKLSLACSSVIALHFTLSSLSDRKSQYNKTIKASSLLLSSLLIMNILIRMSENKEMYRNQTWISFTSINSFHLKLLNRLNSDQYPWVVRS